MPAPLRKVLIDSHVASVTIAVLIYWSVGAGFFALWYPFYHLGSFLITAILIRDIPYMPHTPDLPTLQNLLNSLFHLFSALTCIAAACLLSRWTYGTGVLRAFGSYRDKLARKKHA